MWRKNMNIIDGVRVIEGDVVDGVQEADIVVLDVAGVLFEAQFKAGEGKKWVSKEIYCRGFIPKEGL
jgi:hypothetical protein